MFQRIHNQKESDNRLREEDDGSVHGSSAGNEAALVNNLITNESNEANNALINNLISNEANNIIDASDSEDGDTLAHYLENDLNRVRLKPPKKKAKRARDKKPILFNEAKNAGLDGDIDLIFNDSADEDRKNIILNDTGKVGDAQSEEGNNDPPELEEPIIKKDPNALINNIINEDNGTGSGEQEKKAVADLIGNAVDEDEKIESSKGSAGKKNDSESSGKAPDDRIRNEDLKEADEDMKPIDGWNFNATKLPARKTAAWWKKALTRISYYTGKTIGKIGGFFFHLFTGGWKIRARSNARDINKAAPQERRDHESIPGWDGAKWEGYEQRDDEPDIDIRKVPAIWSYPIAAKAEKSPDKPEDPVISIYVSQPRQGEDDITINNNETGHSGIGIEFSRKSNVTGEWERYNMRFGYYTAGGIDPVSSNSVMAYNRALVPGQLMNERGRQYDVSRSYKISNQQVNAVLKAAETYPDKGYNGLTRNCTTFAKEMIVKYAHIPAGEAIFKKEALEYSAKQNLMLLGAGSISMWGKAGMEQNLTKLTRGDDTNYSGYGNKRMTREEYNQYYNSLSYFRSAPLKADTPNGAAENMRRLEGPDRGTIGSFRQNNDSVLSPLAALTRLTMAADTIRAILQQITPADQLEHEHCKNAFQWVSGMGKSLLNISKFEDIKDKHELRDLRTKLAEDIDNLNTILFDYYNNDINLHKPVLDAISILTNAINGVDAAYESCIERTRKEDDELNNLRVSFTNTAYNIRIGNEHTIEMTPSLYEAYLQVYKTPDAALHAILRFNELSNLNADTMTPEQKKELEKTGRMEALVREFEKSHRYMLEKKSFTQQDIDYAFGLEKKERTSSLAVQSEMYDEKKTASSTYKTLFLEKIFGGMKGRYRDFRNKPQAAFPGGKMLAMGGWLDKEFLNCANPKKDEIKMILNGIAKSMNENPTRDKLAFEFLYMLKGHWFRQLYDEADRNSDEFRELEQSYESIRKYGKFRNLLEELADDVISDLRKLDADRDSVHSDDDD